jgi:tricorn protease
MKNKVLLVTAMLAVLPALMWAAPLWMRHAAISPDGNEIAFSYKGDIFTVSSSGGEARQITSNSAYDSYPVWSPDGSKIAFASSREGSLDVYVMSSKGGEPKRLTTNSSDETPITFVDNDNVLFTAALMPTAKSIIFAGWEFPQIYEVSTNGGRPKLFTTLPMEDISINANGDILYHDMKGYEDPYRKHHQSPITRDIWLCKDIKGSPKFTKLTTFKGEDRTPVWTSDGNSFYYLSEKDGTFNVYKRGLDGSNDVQLTHHTTNPVRYLTASKGGTLCYCYDGEIYTMREGGQPTKLNVSIIADKEDKDLERQIKNSGATEIVLSPKGKEIAFVLHGDVYVTSIDYKTTKQITDTPEQERSIDFAPDGRAIVYASERNGLWQIYQTKIKKADEKNFTYCSDIEEERLTNSDSTSFEPKYSPDGKEVAFLENRNTLKVINLKTKLVRTAMDGKFNFSYQDGDVWFEWSPDSRWLLSSYIGYGGWNSSDIALVSASGNGEIHNLTNSGYNDGNGKWVLGGKAMIYQSDRAGYRSHGSWGAEYDEYIMFFDLDAYEKFRMTKEENAVAEDEKKADEKDKKDKDKKEEKKDDKKKKDEVKPLKFDFDNCKDRIVRLTVNSSRLGDAMLSPQGDTLYYQSAFEGDYDLWKHDMRENKTEIVMKGIGGGNLLADNDFKNLFVCGPKGIKKVAVADGKTTDVDFEANFNYRPYQEREYMFNHIWQQVKDKFYDPNIHGVNWKGYHDIYAKFLPYINNNYDYRDMLSEMLGELNASHTGARYRAPGARLKTASLGIFIDNSYTGNGIKIDEVVKRGPFTVRNTGVKRGDVIEKIDGVEIKADSDYNYLLDGKAGKPVRLTIFSAQTKKRNDVIVKPVSMSDMDDLLYKRWVERNRALVDSLSGGRLAYVHVKEMDSESFRDVYSELLNDKNRRKEAVIVDERHNGGGWLHDDLCTLLSGKRYQDFVPHGKYIGSDPFNKWTKPSCVMICENDYSNGHGFPWVYKTLGIGKLIGAPVAGTMTAVWWETLLDNTMVFGIPQVGCRGMDGKFGENNELYPDIEVYNTPEDYLNGNDNQLKAAVKEMLKEADAVNNK